jgi:hypothetical protein
MMCTPYVVLACCGWLGRASADGNISISVSNTEDAQFLAVVFAGIVLIGIVVLLVHALVRMDSPD